MAYSLESVDLEFLEEKNKLFFSFRRSEGFYSNTHTHNIF